MVDLPFQILLDLVDFSLDFAFVRMPNGSVLRQMKGIPMGDPLSPGMTIGTCAWMEQEWMQTLPENTRQNFVARRFMDDILMIYRKDESWNHRKFMIDFEKSHCYHPPLKLTEGKEGTFLETAYWIEDREIKYQLKNDNADGERNVWRYQHFDSNAPYLQKRATITACLRKVQKMSSDPLSMERGALAKIAEFRRLRYPITALRRICSYLGATSGEGTWIRIREALR